MCHDIDPDFDPNFEEDPSDYFGDDQPTEDLCMGDNSLDAEEIGTLLAMTESKSNIDSKNVDEDGLINVHTDEENWEKVIELSIEERGGNSKPFELMIRDICAGHRSIFKEL